MDGKVATINSNLGTLSFAKNADGKWGYKVAGADPVIPFKELKFAEGNLIGNTTSKQTAICGFKPKYIFVSNYGDISSNSNSVHYEYKDGSQMYQYYVNARNDFTGFTITDAGFEFTGYNASVNPLHYYAIGD